jgi:hypothetical protein
LTAVEAPPEAQVEVPVFEKETVTVGCWPVAKVGGTVWPVQPTRNGSVCADAPGVKANRTKTKPVTARAINLKSAGFLAGGRSGS